MGLPPEFLVLYQLSYAALGTTTGLEPATTLLTGDNRHAVDPSNVL